MIVKVEVKGSRARIRTQDDKLRMTMATTAPLLARMAGRDVAFFDAKVERGGGKDPDGNEFLNPSEIVELGEAMPDQGW